MDKNNLFLQANMYMDGVDHSFKETDEAAVILNTRPEWRLMCEVTIGQWIVDN